MADETTATGPHIGADGFTAEPTLVIVGRPNVGKSTLFNRLVGKKLALVDDLPGVTRDRREGRGKLGDLVFRIIDTAGLEEANPESLEGRMRAQTEAAIDIADVILFVIDARIGLTPMDEHFAMILRRTDKPVVLLANKAEGKAGIAGAYEAFGLGLGDPVPLSAEHGEGMADLFEALRPLLPDPTQIENDEIAEPVEEEILPEDDEAELPVQPVAAPGRPLKVAIVGRPNAGKSTLINRILGEDRLLTGPEAGITRDSISVDTEHRGLPLRLIDTAGMRRKARVEGKLEKLSVADTIRAIKFAEVVVVAFDATIPFEKQDLQIVDLVVREGRALVIALDKWDLIEDRTARMKEMREAAGRLLPQARGVTLVPVSGLTGSGVGRLLDAVIAAAEVWNKRVSTGRLNRWLTGVLAHHPPPAVSGRTIKLRYLTQAKTRPPHFVVFCSRPEALPDSYRRYLINGMRETFDLPGVPVRLTLRKSVNPFADK